MIPSLSSAILLRKIIGHGDTIGTAQMLVTHSSNWVSEDKGIRCPDMVLGLVAPAAVDVQRRKPAEVSPLEGSSEASDFISFLLDLNTSLPASIGRTTYRALYKEHVVYI